jgi:hypothetical protein
LPPGLRFACSSISFFSVTNHTTATQNVTHITLYRQPAPQAAVSSLSSAPTITYAANGNTQGFVLYYLPTGLNINDINHAAYCTYLPGEFDLINYI